MAVRNPVPVAGPKADSQPCVAKPIDKRAVTALILTFNEESNIARTLAGLAWVDRILVVDSGSTDATLALL